MSQSPKGGGGGNFCILGQIRNVFISHIRDQDGPCSDDPLVLGPESQKQKGELFFSFDLFVPNKKSMENFWIF